MTVGKSPHPSLDNVDVRFSVLAAETFLFFRRRLSIKLVQDPEVQWLVRIPLAHSYTYAHRAAC